MIYHAVCKPCGARWQVRPPSSLPVDLHQAVVMMEQGNCPECHNDGSKGPINWRFTFSSRDDPHFAQVRAREDAPPQIAPRRR